MSIRISNIMNEYFIVSEDFIEMDPREEERLLEILKELKEEEEDAFDNDDDAENDIVGTI